MRKFLALGVLTSLSLVLLAQSRTVAGGVPASPATPASGQPAVLPLNPILTDLQRTTQAANLDLSKLRIEKWKVDESEKQQMQQVAISLQKNITVAVPGLISDLQATPGSVSKAFKLYHDLNVVYEFMNSIAEAAGAYGRKEEYTPLASDVSALDSARQSLSTYIEQTANTLEIQAQKPAPVPQQQATQSPQAPKRIVIDDDSPPVKKTVRKKKPAATPTPSPTPSAPQ